MDARETALEKIYEDIAKTGQPTENQIAMIAILSPKKDTWAEIKKDFSSIANLLNSIGGLK